MPQNTAIRTTARTWDFLEPAMNPEYARTDHGVLIVAGAGLTVVYPKGQILCQKDDGTNVWAKIGTAGYAGPKRVLKYPVTVNELGQYQYGATFFTTGNEIFEGSVDFYYQGFFKCQDLVGLDGTTQPTVGRLIRGTFTTGIIELGAAPVAA